MVYGGRAILVYEIWHDELHWALHAGNNESFLPWGGLPFIANDGHVWVGSKWDGIKQILIDNQNFGDIILQSSGLTQEIEPYVDILSLDISGDNQLYIATYQLLKYNINKNSFNSDLSQWPTNCQSGSPQTPFVGSVPHIPSRRSPCHGRSECRSDRAYSRRGDYP